MEDPCVHRHRIPYPERDRHGITQRVPQPSRVTVRRLEIKLSNTLSVIRSGPRRAKAPRDGLQGDLAAWNHLSWAHERGGVLEGEPGGPKGWVRHVRGGVRVERLRGAAVVAHVHAELHQPKLELRKFRGVRFASLCLRRNYTAIT